MNIQQIGQSDGEYDVIPRQMGDDMMCIRAEVPNVEQRSGEIVMVDSLNRNTRMFWYRVVKQGVKVNEKTSINVGDYVYVDMLARFADTFPISFINCKNVLFRTDINGNEVHALKGRIILEAVEPKETVNEYGFIQITDIDPYGIVRSIGEGCEYRGYGIGDKVSLHSSEDNAMYVLGKTKYFDYDYRLPAVKFNG